jgi:hypothetical protein
MEKYANQYLMCHCGSNRVVFALGQNSCQGFHDFSEIFWESLVRKVCPSWIYPSGMGRDSSPAEGLCLIAKGQKLPGIFHPDRMGI